ncbi:hypothetical protein [Streptomyces viridosporus]|uniref:Uncharacterized protein n=1 Tax=Streptomyces viridosporus T7A TaxID=665577 RepID=A0ABX6AIH7_STRVD|nr:hypothetical protein [Streptomyces viridosporus]QEU87446.1 hypothetical protein CP969_24275 [Streptomyces viridosporus T7A]
MTPNTPAPHPGTPPGRAGSRLRGRHRRPRPRKVLPALGGLALAAGALGLVRLVSGPGGEDIGVEAVPRPSASTRTPATATSGTPGPPSRTPGAGPSSPTALGGQAPVTLTPGTSAPPAPARSTATTAATATTPAVPSTAPPPDPTTRVPGPVTPPPPAPSRTRTPPPVEPPPARPGEPGPVVCVPVIDLCVGVR